MKILYAMGIMLSLFLLFLLMFKPKKARHEQILAWWMGMIAVHQLLVYGHQSGEIFQYPHLLGIEFSLPLIQAIFHFFYVSEITRPGSTKIKKWIPHLMPVVILILLAIPFYALSGEEKIKVYEHDGEGFVWYNILQVILIVVLGLGYAFWSLLLIQKHQLSVQQLYSNTEGKNLRWLQYLSIGLGGIWLLVIAFDDAIIFAGVAILVLFIGFFGINQVPIFYSRPEDKEEELEIVEEISPSKPEAPERYVKSGLKAVDVDLIYERLTHTMEQDRLYLQSDLSLAELAAHLHIHPNHLSQVINVRSQKNFFHYINTLRVEAFIQLASDPVYRERHTLLAIAFDCGFNSKSTFNKYFKQHTGQTPTQFFR